MGDQDIADWIGIELEFCDWVHAITFDGCNPIVDIQDDEGVKFRISVSRLLESSQEQSVSDGEIDYDSGYQSGVVKGRAEIIEKIRNVLYDDDLCAEAMVAEIGELLN